VTQRSALEKKRKDSSKSHISRDQALDVLDSFISTFLDKYNISYMDVISRLTEKSEEELSIPIEIFQERRFGILEIIVKFLKEEHHLRYKEIARIINRDERTIWVTYHKAVQKKKSKFEFKDSKYWIPVMLFSNRNLGLLQVIVKYLKDDMKMTYHEIAVLLNRDDRVIWAVYNKIKW